MGHRERGGGGGGWRLSEVNIDGQVPKCTAQIASHSQQPQVQVSGTVDLDLGNILSASDKLDRKPGKSSSMLELSYTQNASLEHKQDKLRSEYVQLRRLEFAPPWVMKDAFEKEHGEDWLNAYTAIDEISVPMKSIVMRSHVVYRMKQNMDGSRLPKACICSHGSEEDQKDELRIQ